MNKKVKNASDKKELLLLLEEDWQKIVNIIAEILDIKVDLVMESALKPNIGKNIKDEVVMI